MARKKRRHEPAITRISLAEAGSGLVAIVERLQAGKERVILEKDGVPVAALMDIDEFEDYLELHDPEVSKAIAEGRQEHLAGRSRPAAELLRELEEEDEREREPEASLR